MKKIFIIITVFLFATYSKGYTQELEATVTVNIDQLDFEARTYVASMKYDLENYINYQRYTDIDWEGSKIPVDINIFLSGGYNKRYNAQLVIVSKRVIRGTNGEGQSVELQLLNKNWSFEYQGGSNFSYNPTRYNEFSSIIDFYMLMVIGFDFDTFGELDGSKYYEQSKQIAMMAAALNKDGFSTNYAPGEVTKMSLISEMNDPRYNDFRKLIFAYYVDGIDKMVENKEEGLNNLEWVISEMAAFKEKKMTGPSVFLQTFFESKHLELAALFKGQADRTVWDNLIYLDPTNTMLYQDSQKGK
ncbi:MAG: hypothetical protein A2X64_01580 [Ignavibacteria bacterium GWF2_33_9]|nr:MAG: hypothetical protein A2X64_01580 [Ignavibacteria bacterium GWF2_33_9]